jgi:benzoate-CoA ligase family protein
MTFNAAVWLVDRHLDEGRGGRVALRSAGASITYAELHRRVVACAAGMTSDGISPEDRVALLMLDSPELATAFLAAMRIGAIPVPINPLLPPRDVDPIVADARAALVLRDELPLTVGDAPVYGSTEESPGFWLCTSGTTGTPKLAMHRHADLRTTAGGYAQEVLEIGEHDVCYSVGPMFHAYGLGNSLSFPLSVGATSVLERTRPPTPALVGRIACEERPTLFFCVPTFYAALLASDLPSDTFSSVRMAVSAGEPLAAELFNRFKERFGVEILDGIGSTEMTHIFISNRRGQARAGTSGVPVGGYDVKLTDESGAPVADGEPGHLWVRGDSAATGYWCRTEASRRTFAGEWTRTGDVYSRDQDGYYTYLGRSDDMFKVGGEWVSPAEVEAVLIEHQSVLEAAVVGEPTEDGVLKPAAFVVCKGTPDAAALEAHCRDRLAGYKRPRRIEFVDELPKTVTGKIQRFRLRA